MGHGQPELAWGSGEGAATPYNLVTLTDLPQKLTFETIIYPDIYLDFPTGGYNEMPNVHLPSKPAI